MTATVARPTRPTEDELSLARGLLGILPNIGRLASQAADECGLARERCRLLFMLGDTSLRTGLLAQRLKISPATVSELVDGLVSEGLVHRSPDPDDRRAVVLELTPEGRRQRQRYEQSVAAALADVFAVLTPTQQRRLAAAFADIRSAFTASSHPEPSLQSNTRKEKVFAR